MDGLSGKLGRAAEYLNTEGMELREYQLNVINSVLRHGNSLVVLPTGLGKTLIGAAIASHTLSLGKKVLFLAPTKPLAEQHHATLSKLLKLNANELLLLTGSLNKSRRTALEEEARVIVATPQTISNDLKNGLVTLDAFGCCIFDECHRAVGKYAYTYIANECATKNVLILGLTASPGSKREKIKALTEELSIRHIDVRVSTDPDVAPYVMAKNMHVLWIDLNESIAEISRLLAPEAEASLRSLNKVGLLHFKNFDSIPKGRLLQVGTDIGKIQASNYRFAAIFAYVKLLNITHAYDLLRSEGFYPFNHYWETLEMREKKSRGLESVLANPNIKKARQLALDAVKRGEEHAKVFAVLDILRKTQGKGAILFAQYRSTVKMLVEFLTNNGLKAKAFVGKKEGITQEMQKGIINDFRNKQFDVLVASSIGEEGLDIPNVDTVIFYEPIPNEIRNIQRRGRTGRFRDGEVYILVANGTKDEIYMQISRQKEQKMLDQIQRMNITLAGKYPTAPEGQNKLYSSGNSV